MDDIHDVLDYQVRMFLERRVLNTHIISFRMRKDVTRITEPGGVASYHAGHVAFADSFSEIISTVSHNRRVRRPILHCIEIDKAVVI
jgi:hypothetical protein